MDGQNGAATVLAQHHVEEELKRELELVQPQNHTEAVTIVKDRIHKPYPATLTHAIYVSINCRIFLINCFNVQTSKTFTQSNLI